MLLRLVLFLLLINSPVYGLTVPLYGTYSFDTKQLTVFWNLPINYDSYTIKIYSVVYLNRCDVEPQQTLINTYTTPVSSKSFNVPNLNYKDTYNVEIFGVNGTSLSKIASQIFWVQVITPEFGVEWCMDDSSNTMYSWTGYKLYRSSVPSFIFNDSETLEDWKKKTFDKSLEYGTKINYLLTSASKLTPSSVVTESPPSAQLILYVVLPPKPVWTGLLN